MNWNRNSTKKRKGNEVPLQISKDSEEEEEEDEEEEEKKQRCRGRVRKRGQMKLNGMEDRGYIFLYILSHHITRQHIFNTS